MADTTIYVGDLNVDSLFEALQQQALSEEDHVPLRNQPEDNGYAEVFWLFIIVVGFVAVRRAWKEEGTTVLPHADRRFKTGRSNRAALLQDYHVYEGRNLHFSDEQYETIISKRIPYFRKLSASLQETFLRRTKLFLQSKTFLIKSDEPFVDMPILLSATAVQLTFGLKQFMLPHYRYIRIYEEEYFAKGTLRVLAGHVYGNTITVAWNHFLQGYENCNDGTNLGLHEMAHAVYYQLVEADSGRCRRFKRLFKEVISQGVAVHNMVDTRPSPLFSNNAYRNLQEFWAESVELFFERPVEMRRSHATLFQLMQDILLQNPSDYRNPVL